jgi:Bacterial regulatory proteins, tetR family
MTDIGLRDVPQWNAGVISAAASSRLMGNSTRSSLMRWYIEFLAQLNVQPLLRLAAGRTGRVRLGYHRARIDDVVEATGVSHGAFYRNFENKDQLARVLTTRAMRAVSIVLAEIPALVLLAVLSAFGSRARPPADVDAAAHIIQQGFLGL